MYNIIFLNFKDRDFSQICKNGTLSVIYLESLFLHCIVFWKEKILLSLVKNIKEDYALAKHMPENEQEVMEHYAQRIINIYKLWVFIAGFGTAIFPLENVVLITYSWINGELRLIPLYYIVYPNLIEDNMNNLCIFILTYIAFLLFGVVSAFMLIAFVPLGPAFIMHACGQLDVVKLRIQLLFKNDNIEEARKGLKDVVKQLQYIYE